jgi:CHAT domain-containing protein
VVIVADAALQQVPFAALYDSSAKRYLVETMAVAIAASASALRTHEVSERPHAILGVALPSGSMAALPDAERELADVCALYPRSVTIDPQSATLSAVGDAARTAGVIHIAGHTASGADDLALQFSSSRTGMQRVSWRDLAALRLTPSAVVVVAGCETLRGPDAGRTRGLSLGGGFLAAGAADVVGTLAPIADRDARDFFRDLHRHLAGGASAGDALRDAQRAAIRSESSTGRRTAWRAVALLTSHI